MKNVMLNLVVIISGLFSSLSFAHEGHTRYSHTHIVEYGVVVILVFIGVWVYWNFFSRD